MLYSIYRQVRPGHAPDTPRLQTTQSRKIMKQKTAAELQPGDTLNFRGDFHKIERVAVVHQVSSRNKQILIDTQVRDCPGFAVPPQTLFTVEE